MIKLRVNRIEAENLVDTVFYKTFQEARKNHWHLNEDGFIQAQSVLWLFCWAKTGMGSKKTAQASQQIFDKIFPFSYNFFNSRIPHNYAREKRYSNEDIEKELKEMLAK